MNQRINNTWLTLIFAISLFGLISSVVHAETSCGLPLCWNKVQLSPEAEVGEDNVYFSNRYDFRTFTGNFSPYATPNFNTGASAEGIFEIDDAYDFSPMTAFYSFTNPPNWLPAEVSNHVSTTVGGELDREKYDAIRLNDGRYIFIRAHGDLSLAIPDSYWAKVFNADGSLLSWKSQTDIEYQYIFPAGWLPGIAISSDLTQSNQFVAAYRESYESDELYGYPYIFSDILTAKFSVDDQGQINRVPGTTKRFNELNIDPSVQSITYNRPDIVDLPNGVAIVANSSTGVGVKYIPDTGTPGAMHFIDTADGNGSPKIESLPNGGFVVVWREAGTNIGIYIQIFDPIGDPVNSPIKVNITDFSDTLRLEYRSPTIIRLADDSYIIAWSYGIYIPSIYFPYPLQLSEIKGMARRFSSSGSPMNTLGLQEFETATVTVPTLNDGSRLDYSLPFLGALPDGGFYAGITHLIDNETTIVDEYGSSTTYDWTTIDSIAKRYTLTGINLGIEPPLNFGESSMQDVIASPGGLAGIQQYSELIISPAPGGGNYYNKNSYMNFILLDGHRKIETPSFSAYQDIDLRFYLEDLGGQWFSDDNSLVSPRHYIYAPFNEGDGGSVVYPDGLYGESTVDINIIKPTCEICRILQVQSLQTPLVDGVCGSWAASVWNDISDDTDTLKASEIATLDVETCYRFRAVVRNVYGHEYYYNSPNILRYGGLPLELTITSAEVLIDQLTIQVNIAGGAAPVDLTTYQINNETPVEFSGNIFTATLPGGTNRVRVEATNSLGELSFVERYFDVNATPSEIFIVGIEDGGVYSDNAEFLLDFTQSLTDVVILVDGVARNDLIGLAGGVHTLIVQGRDALNNLISKSVTFTIDSNSFTISLLSPQQKTYESNTVRIQYSSSQPLTNVWYTLNGGPQQQDFNLTDLADGNYTLVFYGQKADSQITSVTRNFTVQDAVPDLQVFIPQEGAVYTSNQLSLSFTSNGPVTYQLGDESGAISDGGVLSLPQDGEHTLVLTATHLVSGNVVSQRINFSTDSIAPTLELLSPKAAMYPFDEIPIEYSSNKPLVNIQFLLDGSLVSGNVLSQLSIGTHSLQITAEDSSGRQIIPQNINFIISQLGIVSPQEGAEFLSDELPPLLPFEYEADGIFTNFKYSIDNETQRLVPGLPGDNISIPVSPGGHEIALTGNYNEFRTTKRANFRIGSKNLAVGKDSINYDYFNCNAEQTECDVNISITVSNIGDYDIAEQIEVRFDHIGPSGYQTEDLLIAGLTIGGTADLVIPTLRARLGDTFSLTLDPYAKLSGEWPSDNQHYIQFQSGQITGVSFKFPSDNNYFQGVSVFDMAKVDTAGPVSMVEYRVGDWTFFDDTSSDGFESIVDLGLLSQSNSCVTIVAFGSNSVALDSRSQCFNIKRLGLEPLLPMKFNWSAHSTGTNRVNINSINRVQLAFDLADVKRASLLSHSSVLPNLQENGRVIYTLISNPAGAEGRQVSQSSGLNSTTPIVGNAVPLPNGHGMFFTTVDPNANTCSSQGAIPIFTKPHSEKIAEIYAEEIAGINAMGSLGLSPLQEMLRIILSVTAVPYVYRSPEDIAIDYKDTPIFTFTGSTYLGVVNVQIPSRVAHIDIQGELVYGFDPNDCLFIEEQDGNIDLVLNTAYEFGLKDAAFNLSTGRFSLSTAGLAIFDVAGIPVLPLAAYYGGITVYPQRFHVPLELSVAVDMSIVDSKMYFGPAKARSKISVNHNSRLADAEIQVYPLILFGLGKGVEYKANLSLNGYGKTDWVGGSNDDWNASYIKFDGSIIIKKRDKYCFLGVCYKEKWKIDGTPYDEHIDGGEINSVLINTPYTDQDVTTAFESIEPFWEASISDLTELGLYYLITGDQQASQDLLTCGLFLNFTATMSHSPIYELSGGSCQAIQSPDSGSYTEIYTDATCQTRAPYKPTSFLEYCQNNLLSPTSETFIGNANAWVEDGDPAYDSIGRNTRWTLSHGTRLDIAALSQSGNRRPFMKKVEYRKWDINSGLPNAGCSLEMRVYKQDILAQNLRPLMFIHGGAWKFRGLGTAGMEAYISHLTERGYIVFAPYHRLMSSSEGPPEEMGEGPPECQNTPGVDLVTDAVVALDWVKLHGPTLGAANQQITLIGQSAGAHLAGWLAVDDIYGADILKSVLFYPPLALENFVQETGPDPITGEPGLFQAPDSYVKAKALAATLLSANRDSNIDRLRDSPTPTEIEFVQKNGIPRRISEGAYFAPTFIIHGNADGLVPIESSTRLCDAMAGRPFETTPTAGIYEYECGTGSQLKIIDGADHVLDLKCFSADIDPSILELLKKNDPSFDETIACPSGLAGVVPTASAIESALQWLN